MLDLSSAVYVQQHWVGTQQHGTQQTFLPWAPLKLKGPAGMAAKNDKKA